MSFGQKYGLILGALSSLLFWSLPGYTVEPNVSSQAENNASQPAMPLAATNANWIFSGSVSSENGEAYEYFFQAKRKQDLVQATVSLVDAQTKAVIFMQSADTHLTEADAASDHWVIGDIFLRYNTINRTWVFGLKKANQIGFNFKVDTLNQSEHPPQIKKVRKGVLMTMIQTGQVNGHIQLKEEGSAQFVTGKNAWFREVIMHEASGKLPPMNGLLCHFNDGSGLYSMRVGDKQSKNRIYAGSYNEKGIAANVSKSIHIDHLNSGAWRVNIPYPKLQFDFNNVLDNQPIVLGFIDQKQKSGFCVISTEEDVA
jgi:hypothetical protein